MSRINMNSHSATLCLLASLDSPDREERSRAESLLLKVIRSEKNKNVTWKVVGCVSSALILTLCLRRFTTTGWDVMGGAPLLLVFLQMAAIKSATEKQRYIVQNLCRSNNVHVAGILLDALSFRGVLDAPVHVEVTQALLRLLPRMQLETWNRLGAHQKVTVSKLLFGKDEKLVLVLLEVLAAVGDERACTSVNRLAGSACKGRPLVKDAAQDCLRVISARLEQQRNRDVLLRSVEESDNAQLLRIPQDLPSPEANNLLRPSR